MTSTSKRRGRRGGPASMGGIETTPESLGLPASSRKRRPMRYHGSKTAPPVAVEPAERLEHAEWLTERDSQISVPPVATTVGAEATNAAEEEPRHARGEVHEDALVDDVTGHFFAGRSAPAASFELAVAPGEHPLLDDAPPPISAKMAPAVVARRARLARVVGAAIGLCAVVCVAGFVAERGRAPRVAVASAAAPPALVAAAEPGPSPVAKPDPTPGASDEAADDPAEAPEPAETDTADAPVDPAAAHQAKLASLTALSRSNLARAIELGEASVAADPSDAEAWLILGAAYQAKGDFKDMRRVFHACVEQGKGARRSECAQFPH